LQLQTFFGYATCKVQTVIFRLAGSAVTVSVANNRVMFWLGVYLCNFKITLELGKYTNRSAKGPRQQI
jgi:hypothetical protein